MAVRERRLASLQVGSAEAGGAGHERDGAGRIELEAIEIGDPGGQNDRLSQRRRPGLDRKERACGQGLRSSATAECTFGAGRGGAAGGGVVGPVEIGVGGAGSVSASAWGSASVMAWVTGLASASGWALASVSVSVPTTPDMTPIE